MSRHPHHERPWEDHEKDADPNYGRTCICGAAIRAGGRLVHECKGPPGYVECGPDGKVRKGVEGPEDLPEPIDATEHDDSTAADWKAVAKAQDADLQELRLLAAEACFLLEQRTRFGMIGNITSAKLGKWWKDNKDKLKEPARRRVYGA